MDYKKDKIDYITAAVFIILIAFVPLIVRAQQIGVNSSEYGFLRVSKEVTDIFSYYKSVVFCILSFFLFFMMLIGIYEGRYNVKGKINKLVFIFSGIYTFLAIMSSIFSPYKDVVMTGLTERYESIWVIISYIFVLIFFMLICEYKDMKKFILIGLFLSIFFVGTVGAFQYFGFDFFKSDFGAKLVLGDLYEKYNGLRVKFTQVYSTLYNPNCVGLYCSLTLPFSAMLAMLLPVKNILKYICMILTILLGINLVGSRSAAGIIGIAFSFFIIFFLFVIRCVLYKSYKVFGFTIAFLILFSVVTIVLYNNNNSFNEKVNIIKSEFNNSQRKSPYLFRDFRIENNMAYIEVPYDIFTIYYENPYNIAIKDKSDDIIFKAALNENKNKQKYTVKTKNIGNLQCSVVSGKYITVSGDKKTFIVEADGKTFYAVGKDYSRINLDYKYDSIGFNGLEYFATSRGYIWSRSIPLIYDNILIGSGPDTFAFQFPQNDLRGKTKFLGDPYINVDKPHNFYIQQCVNTGLLSLIALICIFTLFIFTFIVYFIKENIYSFDFAFKTAVFAGIIGYMITAMATDSIVSVSPLFWVMLGVGLGIRGKKI